MTTGKMTIITDMGEGKSETIDAVSMADYLEMKRKLKIAEEKFTGIQKYIEDRVSVDQFVIYKEVTEALSAIREE